MMKLLPAVVLTACLGTPALAAPPADLAPLQQFGKAIFFDTNLSEPKGQACASCHLPAAGFAGPEQRWGGVQQGALPGRFGNRTPPSAAYAAFTPPLHWNKKDETYVGGLFRDGRAADLGEQAKGPFLNPLEMNMKDGQAVCERVAAAPYAQGAATAIGKALDCTGDGFEQIARALAAYEASAEVSPFSSKYDAYLAGRATLTAQEAKGLKLYEKKAMCAECHPSRPGAKGEPPLFTDFTYDNIGTPKNTANPFYGMPKDVNAQGDAWADDGLATTVGKAAERGKFKVPTLRNIAAEWPPGAGRRYMHNGVFETLEEVVHFYNARDVDKQIAPPEVAENVNKDELGNLKLTKEDEAAVVAFLKTLTDGWTP